MEWLKLDTGLFENEAIRELIEVEGDEGFRVWLQTRLEVVKHIDFQNEANGELAVPGRVRSPLAYVSFFTRKPEDRVRDIFDSAAELGLIDPDTWEDDRIYFPDLLERDSVETFLKKQRGGQKGGSRSPTRSPSSSPTTDTDIDTDKDRETKEKPEPSDPDDLSEEQLREDYGHKAVKFTDRFIERCNEINPRRNTPAKGTESYEKWVRAFDRLNRIGPQGGTEGETGYSWQELSDILQFVFDHDGNNGFSWADQVRSPVQLRTPSGSNDDAKIVKIEEQMKRKQEQSKSQAAKEWEDAD